MIQNEITLNDLYNLLCVLLHNKTDNEVWISNQVMQRLRWTIDIAMEQGAKINTSSSDSSLPEGAFKAAGFTFIVKPNIEGVMCFGNKNFSLNEKDTPFEEFFTLTDENEIPRMKATSPEEAKKIAGYKYKSNDYERK